ncbi:chromosome segregation protein SMC [Nitrosomonas sp. HPC101]|uniref:chromosome segregation protein SMC n=1 Tax=Nitrosomonas sp. HPC101 TaxID=1658667 RepID=UPI001370000B|nr:chromosome segregation protein SMC [Nitrosomonas sp. HPC101]MXS84701.1 chromosome segregation protein SMC [Nitrosomonas sp. HPC101]
MRLTEIKLAGFKTFVDPAVVPVPGNLVGIVGPNGCGKSNIIDAVRWVLGESRASALRGESLQDVIFNGSATRKSVGRASVELIFDNSAGKAAGQWKAYSEIAIRRVVQRDGESSYYINNIRVRRRDITDMFLGTGVSGRGYAIIEQGMISRIIEARPQELRAFLEEASGISRYHEKRRETGLRLSDARGNLQRVDDVLQELGKQQQHLEAQAEHATRYQDWHKQLTAAQHALWTLRRQEAAESWREAQGAIERLTQEMEIIRSSVQEAGEQLDELRMHHRVVNDRQHQIQGELYAADGEMIRIEQNIHHIRANREQLNRQITEAAQQLHNHEQQLNEVNENLASWQSKLEQTKSYHLSCKEKHAAEAGKLPQMESSAQADQVQLTGLREELALARQNEKLQQSQRTYAEKTLRQLMVRRERLLEEQLYQPEIDSTQLDELQMESAELAALLEQNQYALGELETQICGAQQERDTMRQIVQSLQHDMVQVNAQRDILQRLQDQIEDNQELNAWMAKNQLDMLPRLWQQISVESGWETALEAILRERIQAVAVDRLEQILDWEADQENRRPPAKWSVCELMLPDQPVDNHAAARPDQRAWKPFGMLLNCHNPAVQAILESWLQGVFVTDSLAAALADRSLLVSGEMLVTAEGHSITDCGVNYFAPDSEVHGILQRQREIAQIGEKCKQIERSVLSRQQDLAEVEQSYQRIAAEIVQIRKAIEESRTQRHERQIQVVQLTQHIERVTQQQAQLETGLADLAIQIEEEASQKYQAETECAACEAERVVLEAHAGQAESVCQLSGQALVSQRLLVQQLSEALHEAAFNEQNCQSRIIDCEQRVEIITRNRGALTENMHKLQHDRVSLDESSLAAGAAHWQVLRDQHEQALMAVRNELENIDNSLLETEQTRMQAEQRLLECGEALGQLRLRAQEAGITEAQFAARLMELGEIVQEMVLQQINETPAKLQTRINRLTGDIAALGPVNLAALQELEALKSRRVHLEEQSHDLREAIATLEQAIRQIDRETRERLQETFNQINQNLVELFASIFGGGFAELVLSGEDILDAGVQLNAHPPGKRNSSIHLLSGGEKALTALALVFSLFRLNPAPFCLLDEVDAPLDDSNAGRFCELVKRMSKETQFLFISHNKIAMQMAQQLIGVTMREQGVSRVVTVDIGKMMTAGDSFGCI